jgi:hypothetical protein
MQLVQTIGSHDVEARCAERIRQGWRVTIMVATGGLVHVVFEKENVHRPKTKESVE